MSIKILDTFEPAGKFSLATAKDIRYEHEQISVEEKIKELDDIINAEPKLTYLDGITEYCPVSRFALGKQVTLEFNLTTASIGNCRILVERKTYGIDGMFSKVKEISEPGGKKTISVGRADGLSDDIYRVYATDTLGKQAKFYRENPDGTLTKQDFLEFRIICGGIQFSSTFVNSTKYNVFDTGFTSLSYPYTINYAVDGYRWLFYTVTKKGEDPSTNFTNWKYTRIDPDTVTGTTASVQHQITLGRLAFSGNAAFRFPANTFATVGNYTLHVCAAVSTSTDISQTLSDESTEWSATIKDNIEILATNSVGITIVSEPSENLTNESFISFTFVPKTNVTAAQGYAQLLATCKVYSDNKVINAYTRTFSCTHAEEASWNLGRLTAADNYKFEIICTVPNSSATAGQYSLSGISIEKADGAGSAYVGMNDSYVSDLLFYFDADPQYFNEKTGVWSTVNTNASAGTFTFVLKNLNKSLGMQEASIDPNSDEKSSVLRLSGDAYGMLRHRRKVSNQTIESYCNPWETVLNTNVNDIDTLRGFTFETYIRSKCIGTLNARAISARNDPKNDNDNDAVAAPGFSIGYGDARVDTSLNTASSPLLEDTWQHIVFTVDNKIKTLENEEIDANTVENINPYTTMRIYINGTLVDATPLDLTKEYFASGETFPLVLNGASTKSLVDLAGGVIENITNQGECEIRLIRGYNRSLTASEVFTNYLNSLSPTGARPEVLARNGDKLLTIIFTKNRGTDISDADIQYWESKDLINKDFNTLNQIKVKKSDTNNTFGSKNTLVNCQMHYYLDGQWECEPNVDVYLQGTSSLEYPVKNYQIKVFEINASGKRVKKKILPPFKTINDGWYTSDSVYTLKCDFMDQSHRNNTPTASYYQDAVLEAAIESQYTNTGELSDFKQSKYSPARQVLESVSYVDTETGKTEERLVRPYRDAIDGFACVVYYNDNDPTIQANDANLSFDETLPPEQILGVMDKYAGSYMFNVDKEGAQLGFEIGEKTTDIKVYDSTDGTLRFPKNKHGLEVIGLNTDFTPCVSFEGSTNSNVSAAAFVPWEYFQIETTRDIFNSKLPLFKEISEDKFEPITFKTFEELLEAVNLAGEIDENTGEQKGPTIWYQSTIVVEEKDTTQTEKPEPENPDETETPEEPENNNSDQNSSSTTISSSGLERLYSQAQYERGENKITGAQSKYDYMCATLEPRYTFADELVDSYGEDIVDTDVYNELTYSTLERAIKWVYDNRNNREQFRRDFSNYFSFEYCLAYFLQMIVFTQVDNAGKNAMFDTWYDGRLYPRPYDMDTQMGLDNSGQDIKSAASELNLDISPTYIKGGSVSTGIRGEHSSTAETWQKTTSKNHNRFKAYNTSESLLWKSFGMYFKQEIAAAYIKLRQTNIYDINSICDYIDSKSAKIIGEKFYNKDAAQKYLSYKTADGIYDATYLRCLQGNRQNRYRQFLTQRLIFLDTFFSHDSSSTNGTIELRANAPSSISNIGIHVYSPQYIRVAVDSGTQADILVYADPTDTYELAGHTYKGTLLRIPTSGTDKNIVIWGAGNIRAVNHTSSLNLTKYDISKAIKMTDIDLSNATMLNTITLGDNKYVRKIKLNNTTALSASINLTGCANLEEVDIANSGLPGIIIAPGSNLKKLNLTNSHIVSLTLEALASLKSENLITSGCNYLNTVNVKNCVLLDNLPLSHLTALTNVLVADCPSISTIDLTSLVKLKKIELEGEGIKKVVLKNCAGEAFRQLNLTGLSSLKHLDLNSVSVNGTLAELAKVYLPSNTGFTYLDLRHAKISTLSSDPSFVEEHRYDFGNNTTTGITFANTNAKLYFEANEAVKVVQNLTYNGKVDYLFRLCKNLERLSNCKISATGFTGADYMFSECTKLTDLGITTNWDLSEITSATRILAACPTITYTSISNLLKKLVNVTSLNSFLMDSYRSSQIGSTNYSKTIKADLFKNNTKLTNLNYGFYNTNFEVIEPGIFDYCKDTLLNVVSTFGGMANLVYAPHSIIKDCSKLESVQGLFRYDTSLGDLNDIYKDMYEEPCILKESFDIFYNYKPPIEETYDEDKENKITDINGMFYNCTNLTMPILDVEKPDSSLLAFMEPLKNVITAQITFFNCKGLKQIPEGVFRNNKELQKIDLFFAGTNVTDLPNNLFMDETIFGMGFLPDRVTQFHTALVTAQGLFANCTQLKGIVNKYFFIGAPNLTRIGGTTKEAILNPISATQIYSLGMFANTLIEGFHEEFLAPLSNLEDTSLLFFSSKNKSTFTNQYEPVESSVNNFIIYNTKSDIQVTDDQTYDKYSDTSMFSANYVLSDKLFKNNSKLTCTAGMFGGNTTIEEISSQLFSNTPLIKNVSHMFIKCTNLAICDLSLILKNKTELTNASHMFADCSNLTYTLVGLKNKQGLLNTKLFEGCTKLKKCKAFLMNTAITGDIPVNLFNDCRATLEDTSYMFAGCTNLTGILETGQIVINHLEDLLELYKTYLRNYFNIIKQQEILDFPYDDYESFEEAVFNKDNPYTASGLSTFEEYKQRIRPTRVIQKGLLSECPKLLAVDHMFCGCTNIQGPIPADMFYTSDSKYYSLSLNSLAGLFESCFKLSLNSTGNRDTKVSFGNSYIGYFDPITGSIDYFDKVGGGNYSEVVPAVSIDADNRAYIGSNNNHNVDDYFVPGDWIVSLPNLTDISKLFYHVGLLRETSSGKSSIVSDVGDNDFTYSSLYLPEHLFNVQTQLTKASGTFAFVGSLGKTVLSSTFLQNSTRLEDISEIFMATKIQSIGMQGSELFRKNSINTYLTNIRKAFYCTNSIKIEESCYHSSDKYITDSWYLKNSYAIEFNDKQRFSKIDSDTVVGVFYNTLVPPYYIAIEDPETNTISYVPDLNKFDSGYTSNIYNSGNIKSEHYTKPSLDWATLFNLNVVQS